ncbi:GNAT family N-acetyltransferase [Evansella tamaricis]|uniref:GNAT family N-acetyltransferase n=1 Tax=Evansella tamaricis TaxID=2069301 RepID=A0ABS6JHB3_9BACI|nr:GNAT family N-acetyltransferase [Evansella tamaricis]MBU9712614.1 GNAT family N-acetyltransferase [Evansella tamaricis]
MTKIQLKEINEKNWEKCISLRVGKDQEQFVASNIYSLVQSRYETSYIPLAAYDEEEMVGFVMYGKDPDDGVYWIVRLMVGEKFQGKGYGKQILLKTMEQIKMLPDCGSFIITSYVPENTIAEKLYEKVGFIKTGEIIDEENIMKFYIV